MWGRIRIGSAAAVLLTATLCAIQCSPARADGPTCNLGDIGQAANDTYNDFLGQCASQFADPAYYPVLLAIGEAALTPQGKDFCHAVIDFDDQVKNAQAQYASAKGDIQTILGYLPQQTRDEVQNSELLKALSNALTTAASSLSEALGILVCSCRAVTSSGIAELGNAVGNCADAALCYIGALSGCDCGNPPPNQYVDCADIIYPTASDPNYYQMTIPYNALPDPGLDVQQFGNYLCAGCESYYGCVPHTFCYCPAPMVFRPGNMEWAGWDHFWECDCPAGSHKAGTGALARVCVCDSGAGLINADGSCPPPPPKCDTPKCPISGELAQWTNPGKTCDFTCGCPQGQVPAGDKCVTPCGDPSQVLLANGTCCSPDKVSSCGDCCPAGLVPDAATGGCGPPKVPTTLPQPGRPVLPNPSKL